VLVPFDVWTAGPAPVLLTLPPSRFLLLLLVLVVLLLSGPATGSDDKNLVPILLLLTLFLLLLLLGLLVLLPVQDLAPFLTNELIDWSMETTDKANQNVFKKKQ
jgi:hypothetical protein